MYNLCTMKTIVLIPAYNEERSIDAVVRKTKKNRGITECVVVDDCSTDDTAAIAQKAGAHIIRKRRRGGTGDAIKTGLQYVAKHGADRVILMDADGQHDPGYLSTLMKMDGANEDYIIASRYLRPGEQVTVFARRLGTKIIALMFRLLYGQYISDPTSGFRALNKKTMHYLADRFPVTFNEPETALLLIEGGFFIKEIPCQMKPRLYGSSSITSLKATYLMTYIFIKLLRRKWQSISKTF